MSGHVVRCAACGAWNWASRTRCERCARALEEARRCH